MTKPRSPEILITHAELKKILDYNQDTGAFVWKKRMARCISVGDVAGCEKFTYKTISINKKRYYSHRLAWLYVYGVWPEFIDHINHDKKDNRLINLRDATTVSNGRNRPLSKNNKSGLHGVCYDKRVGLWMVYLFYNNKQNYLGRFASKFEACCVRKSAENSKGFHPNHGSL